MKIWIDLDNSPHVPLFVPIIKELQKKGISTIVTARDYAQTIGLLELHQIQYIQVGKHGGKNKFKKILNLCVRTIQLLRKIHNKRIVLAVSHGSRTQALASWLLGIKSILMLDYEYTESKIFNLFCTWILMPQIIPESRLKAAGFKLNKVIRYDGYKEEIYLGDFVPRQNLREELQISKDEILVTIRPSALLGNYHNPESEKILSAIIKHCLKNRNAHVLIVSRTKEDKAALSLEFGSNIHFLEKPVNGLELIWNSDIFISGGGTMNREAALLNVPTYSVFMGGRPYLDEHLETLGKLTFIDSIPKIEKLDVKKRVLSINKPEYEKNVKMEVVGQLIQQYHQIKDK